MKKNTLIKYFGVFCFAFISNANAQQFPITKTQQPVTLTEDNETFQKEHGVVRCYSVENEIALQNQNPSRTKNDQFENWLQPKINQLKQDLATNKFLPPVFNIPVVFHVVHNGNAVGSDENISDAQVLSQLSVLQDDFRRVGARGNTNSTGVAVDSEINFCLAKTNPTGGATSGIIRHAYSPPNNTTPAVTDDWETRGVVQQLKATTQWDPTKYLNIWVIKFGGLPGNQGGLQGVLGYAQFPETSTTGLDGLSGGAANTDGVVLSYAATGSIDHQAAAGETFALGAPYNLGRTGTHEVGHWLGLRHTWGDGDCSVDDFVNDTPVTGNSNSGCPGVVDSCPALPGNDMYQNYMDYSNDSCLDTFTQGQKDRMITVMLNSPRRAELPQSNACDAITTPTVGFTPGTPVVKESTGCDFTDYTITLTMNTGGSATTTASLVIEESSATEGLDFELLNNSVSFNSGATAASGSGNITVRVHKDGFKEEDEYIKFGVNVNTSGNTIATTSKFILNIKNDDFETVNVTNDTKLDDDGSNLAKFNTFSSTMGVASNWTNLSSPGINTPGSISGNWYGSQATQADMSDFIIAPIENFPDFITEIKITSAIFTVNSGTLSTYGLFFFNEATNQLKQITTGTAAAFNGSNTPQDNPLTQFVIADATTLNDIKGKRGAFSLRHTTATATNGYLAWDAITIEVINVIDVQTAVNTGSGQFTTSINQVGTAYPKDTATGNAIANIATTTAFDYGCTTVAVSRAGTGAQNQDGTQVSDKTFTITSANDTAASNTITFFFTKAELEGWEAASGESRNDLGIKRIGSSQETVVATVSPYGTGDDFKISGTFTGGIQGTYYFGKLSTLNTASNEFNNFSLFPNPATNEVNIAFDTNNNVNLSLFDIRGRNVLSSNKVNNSNRFETKLDVSNISSGIYLLNITSGDINVTKKIIIN